MKKIVGLVALAVLIFFGQSLNLLAITINSSPPPATSPDILATSIVSLDGTLPDYLEIYNQSASPINLAGFNFNLTERDSTCDGTAIKPALADLSGWLLSKKYFTFQLMPSASSSGQFSIDNIWRTNCSAPWLSSIKLFLFGNIDQEINLPNNATLAPLINGSTITYRIAQHHQRDNSPNSSRTLSGNFADDYDTAAVDSTTSLYSDALYAPPTDTAGLAIVELLPHASNCSPLDTSLTCGDYTKIFNAGAHAVDLSNYRLRTSYGGNKSTSSNTIGLSGSLGSGKYTLINTKNDGTPLALTEGGGYAWLEDSYGTSTYQPLVQYPDSSAANRVGWAWAFDGSTWRWTSSPQPNGPNNFPPADLATLSLSSAGPNLEPCAAGQYRNPATNRCRSIATTSSSASNPCPAGQERNPATNRCRKSSSSVLGASALNIADVAAPTIAGNTQWALAGGALALALGYAVFEWRQEILLKYIDAKAWLRLKLSRLRS